MNPLWNTFLLSQQATITLTDTDFPPATDSPQARLFAPVHLAVLTVGGNDAATLLQGQITCNIKDISENQSSIGALCTAKGRVISTFIVIKSGAVFHLLLPKTLLPTLHKRLQMYVLRSAVTLTDNTDRLCLIGLHSQIADTSPLFATEQQDGLIRIKLSRTEQRYVVIADAEPSIAYWDQQRQQHAIPTSSSQWHYQDILSGLPWLSPETSEEFIPQMLNLDELGGISYNKGCYTGQEIVARTHYLGKAKRALYLAQCPNTVLPAANSAIVTPTGETNTVVGKVLQAALAPDQQHCLLLVVLSATEQESPQLSLDDLPPSPITLLPEHTL